MDEINEQNGLLDQVGGYFSENGNRLLFGIAILIGGIAVVWLFCFLLKKILYKTKIDGALVSFVSSIIAIVSIAVLVIICADVAKLSASGVLVSLGAVALAVGLTLKDSLSDIANGLLIIANKPFRRGDFVSINGVEGKVHSIKLLTVELITAANVKIVLPNSTVLKGNIINYSALAIRRCDMKFSVAYGSDMNKVEEVLKRIATEHPQVLKSMKVNVYMDSHDSSSIVYAVKVWCNNGDYYGILHTMPRMVYDAFEKEGIQIPFNQLDVHISNEM